MTHETLAVVLAGGHSAGHIEPALAVGDAVRAMDSRAVVTALGTTRGLDTTLIPARGYPLELIPPVPFPRRPGKAMATVPLRARAAVNATADVLDRLGADVVVGFGGYVALPAYLAARRRRIPIVVHEANAGAGLANKVGARLTKYVFTAGEGVDLPHAHPIGIPLRPAIARLDRDAQRGRARAQFGLEPDRPTLLVTGGSQGATAVNAVVTAAAPRFAAAGVQVLHVAGPKNADDVERAVRSALHDTPAGPPYDTPAGPPYVTVAYVDQMADAYAAADFVLCRSGAMTVAELGAVGLPAAFVPLPLRGGEAGRNAEPVVAAGGGLLVQQENFTLEWIDRELLPILTDGPLLATMSAHARASGNRDAAQVIAKKALWLAVQHASGGCP